nr:MAG: hypothetical protein [Wufeng bat jingchuvirus 1]
MIFFKILYVLFVTSSFPGWVISQLLVPLKPTLEWKPECMDIPGMCIGYWSPVSTKGQDSIQTIDIILPDTKNGYIVSEAIRLIEKQDWNNTNAYLLSALKSLSQEINRYEDQLRSISLTHTTIDASIRTKRSPAIIIAAVTVFSALGIGIGLSAKALRDAERSLSVFQAVTKDISQLYNTTTTALKDLQTATQESAKIAQQVNHRLTLVEMKVDVLAEVIGLLQYMTPVISSLRLALRDVSNGMFPRTLLDTATWEETIQAVQSAAQAGLDSQLHGSKATVIPTPRLRTAILEEGRLRLSYEFPIVFTIPSLHVFRVTPLPFYDNITREWKALPTAAPAYVIVDGVHRGQKEFVPTALTSVLDSTGEIFENRYLVYTNTMILVRVGSDTCQLTVMPKDCVTVYMFSQLYSACSQHYLKLLDELNCIKPFSNTTLFLSEIAPNVWYHVTHAKEVTLVRQCINPALNAEESMYNCTIGCFIWTPSSCSLSLRFGRYKVASTVASPQVMRAVSRHRRDLPPIVIDMSLDEHPLVSPHNRTPALRHPSMIKFRPIGPPPTATLEALSQTIANRAYSYLDRIFSFFKSNPITTGLSIIGGVLATLGVMFAILFCIRNCRGLSQGAIILKTVDKATANPLYKVDLTSSSAVEISSWIFCFGMLLGLVVIFVISVVLYILKKRAHRKLRRDTPYSGFGQLISKNFTDVINRTLPVITGYDLLPVVRYPHLKNLHLLRSNPATTCLAVVLVKGNVSDIGSVAFTTGLCEVDCVNRPAIKRIFSYQQEITLQYDNTSQTMKGVIPEVIIEWTSTSPPLHKAAYLEFSAPPIPKDFVITLLAFGIRCIRCGGMWCSYHPPKRVIRGTEAMATAPPPKYNDEIERILYPPE